MLRATSFFGLFIIIFLAWLLSAQKWRVNWRIVGIGMCLQGVLAVSILLTLPGRVIFKAIGDFFEALLAFSDAGAGFVFGEQTFQHHFIAFKVLPTIIFVSALMSMLYHVGLMQRVVGVMAWVMRRAMRLSGAESLAAAANVFVGQTEAPLVIKPYVPGMTQSELMSLMVGGMATIAGGVLAAYAGMGIDAAHLVAASVISAAAGLVIAKILQPEVEEPQTLGSIKVQPKIETTNLIEAAAAGASDGLKLALNVAAMLIAFLALIALFDAVLGWLGMHINPLLGYSADLKWSLATILGYLFAPLAWIMGIENADCLRAGELLGLKMVANEFVSYQKLHDWMQPDSGVQLSERTRLLLTYALCGFANFGSIGIQIGGIGAIAPERRADLARLGFRAMLGGTLACCMTACVAGVLLPE
jgi:CNT family concentrative nucleoside transporter